MWVGLHLSDQGLNCQNPLSLVSISPSQGFLSAAPGSFKPKESPVVQLTSRNKYEIFHLLRPPSSLRKVQ
jgi:hypothetical protein